MCLFGVAVVFGVLPFSWLFSVVVVSVGMGGGVGVVVYLVESFVYVVT